MLVRPNAGAVMALADELGPKGAAPKTASVSVKVAPMDYERVKSDASAQLLKAFHAHDANAIGNALETFIQSCIEQSEKSEGEGDPGGY